MSRARSKTGQGVVTGRIAMFRCEQCGAELTSEFVSTIGGMDEEFCYHVTPCPFCLTQSLNAEDAHDSKVPSAEVVPTQSELQAAWLQELREKREREVQEKQLEEQREITLSALVDSLATVDEDLLGEWHASVTVRDAIREATGDDDPLHTRWLDYQDDLEDQTWETLRVLIFQRLRRAGRLRTRAKPW